jgi:outer membrane protein assembly factor BamD (BamD/ComL family)
VRKILSLLFLAAVLAGCLPQLSPPLALSGPEAEYRDAETLLRERKFTEAGTLLKKIVADAPQSPVAADALFDAAYLHVIQDNPQKDYAQAYMAFDEFLKRYPQHPRSPDAQNWKAVLKTVLDSKKENDRLAHSIEQLKKLDIRHEERRSR